MAPHIASMARIALMTDPVIAVAMEYETATLAALAALDRTDRREQLLACIRVSDAVQAMHALAERERNRGLNHLLMRGRIQHVAWERVLHALMEFAAEA